MRKVTVHPQGGARQQRRRVPEVGRRVQLMHERLKGQEAAVTGEKNKRWTESTLQPNRQDAKNAKSIIIFF